MRDEATPRLDALPRCGEWLGVLVSLPSYITGEGDPYRPIAVMWVELDTGLVVGNELVRPGEEFAQAAALFRDATRAPHAGAPRLPRRVRVASAELADALRDRIGDVEVVVAPTPELDPVVASLRDHVLHGFDEDDEEDEEVSYIAPPITPSDIAAFFDEAARLYRRAPWDVVPPDGFISVACEALGIAAGALCVVGQAGDSFGFALFRSESDAASYVTAASRTVPGSEPEGLPQHFMFTYDARADVPPAIVREVAAHGWPVADRDAYPSAVVVDSDLVVRPVARDELLALTAIIRGLAELVEARPDLDDVWLDAEPAMHATRVPTARGEIAVQLAAPLLLEIDDDSDVVLDVLGQQCEDFLDRLADAPGVAPSQVSWADLLSHYAIDYFGALLHELSPAQLDELVFQIVPRKVSCEPDDAPEIIAGARAWLELAASEPNPGQARACLKAVRPESSKRLARLLADPRNFGMAKSIVMAGKAAGFDMTSEQGLASFMAATGGRMPSTATTPGPRAVPKAAKRSPPRKAHAKAKPTKRKTERKARKKSKR